MYKGEILITDNKILEEEEVNIIIHGNDRGEMLLAIFINWERKDSEKRLLK